VKVIYELTEYQHEKKENRERLTKFLLSLKRLCKRNGLPKGNFYWTQTIGEPQPKGINMTMMQQPCVLRQYNLIDDFKLNLEVNLEILTLQGSPHFSWELGCRDAEVAKVPMDANRGDNQNGWDTRSISNMLWRRKGINCYICSGKQADLKGGGINFDTKTRRNSTGRSFTHTFGGMDAFARALIADDWKQLQKIRLQKKIRRTLFIVYSKWK